MPTNQSSSLVLGTALTANPSTAIIYSRSLVVAQAVIATFIPQQAGRGLTHAPKNV